jgi:hypothetical protein
MDLVFLKPEDETWHQVLARLRHDFYHLPGYTSLSSKHDSGDAEAALLRRDDNILFIPYLVRDLSQLEALGDAGRDLKDITSAYGYPGPLLRSDDAEFPRDAIRAFGAAMRDRGVVSGFLRLHPLLSPLHENTFQSGSFVPRGKTVSIDLTLDAAEIWRQTRPDHRRNINKTKRTGFTVAMDQDLHRLDEFLEVYAETMDRLDAADYYYFRRDYYVELAEALGGALWSSSVLDPDGRVVASGFFTEVSGIVQFHLSGTRTDSLKAHPSKLMIDFVRTWAKERGNEVMHLGGGYGGKEDALYAFKAGFSHRSHDFATWHLVFMEDAYHDLMRIVDRRGIGITNESFFPAYRAAP